MNAKNSISTNKPAQQRKSYLFSPLLIMIYAVGTAIIMLQLKNFI